MNLNNLLEVQGMLILLMILGLLLSKIGMINDGGRRLLTDLVICVTLPCSIVKSFLIEFNEQILKSCLVVLILALVIQVGSYVLGKFIFFRYEEGRKKVLQYATVCSNAGILGNPIAEGAFGSIGLLYASVYLIPQRVFMWSVGVTYFTEGTSKKEILKKIVTHPCIVAVVIGMILMVMQWPLPGVIGTTVNSLASSNTALCMILVGSILSGVKWKTIIDKDTIYYSLIRLGIVPLLVFAGCKLAGIDATVAGVSVLLAAMPAASVTAVMAARYGKDEVFAAKIVALTTVLSIVTAPLWCLCF